MHRLLPLVNPKTMQCMFLRVAACFNHTEIVVDLLPHSDSSGFEDDALRYAPTFNNNVGGRQQNFHAFEMSILCGIGQRDFLWSCKRPTRNNKRTQSIWLDNTAVRNAQLS